MYTAHYAGSLLLIIQLTTPEENFSNYRVEFFRAKWGWIKKNSFLKFNLKIRMNPLPKLKYSLSKKFATNFNETMYYYLSPSKYS